MFAKWKIYWLIFICCTVHQSTTQAFNVHWLTNQDSANAILFYNRANQFYAMNQLDSAQLYAEKALEIAENFLLPDTELKSLLMLANIHQDKKEAQFANKYLLIAENKLLKHKRYDALFGVYNQIGEIYTSLKAYDKTIETLNKALEYKQYNANTDLEIKLYEDLGLAHYASDNDSLAITYYDKALLLCKKQSKRKEQIDILHTIVNILLEKQKYEAAIMRYTDIFDLYAEMNSFNGMSNALNNIGYTYTLLNNYNKAIQAYKGALNIDHQAENSPLQKAIVYVNIGICYQNEGQAEEALENLFSALRIYEEIPNYAKIAEVQHLIALVYKNDEDLYNASYYAENSIHNARKSEDMELLKLCYETYSKILQEENEFENALEYYQMYLSIRDSLILEQRLKEQEISQQQYIIEKTEKEIRLLLADKEVKDLALKQLRLEAEKNEQEMQLLKQEKDLKEVEFERQELEKQRALQQLRIANQKNAAKLQEQEIINLQKEKALQDAALKQKELQEKEREKAIKLLERESEIQKLALEKQKEQRQKQRWIGFMFFIILLLVSVGLIITNKKNRSLAHQKQIIEEKNVDLQHKNEEINTQKENLEEANEEIKQKNQVLEQKSEEILAQYEELNQKNEEISAQKEIIEQKNLDITDSIHYASRIQNAVLPPKELVDEVLNEYFILFKPRDIVSGDFFWMRELDDKVIVVAADCTGHGVPGAFMSMLGVSLLNEIVQPGKFDNASDILNKLREEIKISLRQTGKKGEAKDGMDCALCVLEKSKGIMHYAGANNPLYIARNGKVEYYKADRMPIGIYVRSEDPFTNNIIQIDSGDSVYVASDGYTDQFGGDRGKKFLTKNFKDLLSKIYKKPMKYQHDILEKQLKDWMGHKYEQIDDVLVIGFRV